MAASSDTPLTGPDLGAGIPAHTLPHGTLLLGHVDGEQVVLARADGHAYAIGATCSHYGGPLGEGILVGDTVRCPWHHACFSVRTGEALAAPALDPVPCFRVEERDGTLFVRERLQTPPVRSTPAPEPSARDAQLPREIVIVGGGAAGVAAADMLRREGFTGRLVMLDATDSYPVDRPNLSKDYLAGHAEEAWVNLRSLEYYTQHDIEVVLNAPVSRIDVPGRAVETTDGRRFTFDRLLLATGATPVRLRVPGGDLPHVHYLRTLADSRAIITAAERAKHGGNRAVVIGASFIGLEVAAALRMRGLEVHVVAPEERPLARVVGNELGDMVRAEHESRGVTFHLQNGVTSIDATHVHVQQGDALPADLVVVGVGVRPETALAEQVGLAVENGVLVDTYLESSVPGIFAAGDIARWQKYQSEDRLRVEHWVVAERQGQTAARNMLGQHEPYTAVPFFWSRHYELSIDYVGHAERWARLGIDGDPKRHDCAVTYYADDGRTLAVATVSRERASLEAELQLHDAV